MNNDTRERFTLRLPTKLFIKLQDSAKETGVSINSFILQILWNWDKKDSVPRE